MRNRISKRFLTLCISGSLLVVSGIVWACAGGDDYEDFYKSFFAPEVSKDDDSQPYFRSANTFYGNGDFQNAVHEMDSTNLAEWKSFFKDKVTAKDLNYFIYKARIGEIDTCIFYLKNNTFPIKKALAKRSLLSYENKELVKEFLFYLGYAKRCEPYATYTREDWYHEEEEEDLKDPRRNKAALSKLVEGGKTSVVSARSAFIKERYAFQVVRMLYHSKNYRGCLDFYRQNENLFVSKNSVIFRAMGYVAACQYHYKNYPEANYIYSRIFDQCEAMRNVCYMSFHPQEEADWEISLGLAQNMHEREVLWQMLGIYVDPLRAMKEIYMLNPKSDKLDLLLVRAVNINEEDFIPDHYYWERTDSTYALKKQKVDKELLRFTEELANAGDINKPYLWNLSAGYLCLASGDYKKAGKYLNKAEELCDNDVLVMEQIRALKLMNTIEIYTQKNEKTEEWLAGELTWIGKDKHDAALRSSGTSEWTRSRLSEKYRIWGDSIKAQCLDAGQIKNFYDKPVNMEGVISLMRKTNKTEFEKCILAIHPHSEADLITYKAILLIYQYKFEEAAKMFDSYANTGIGMLYADPFMIHIRDCHDCDYELEQPGGYSQYTFVKKMIELQQKAMAEPQNASKYYFMLANGLYNMTYFGNAHHVFSSPVLNLEVGYFSFESGTGSYFDKYFNCNKALEYYQKAMSLSADKEFRAKCTFMSAKCEQNQYYLSKEYTNGNAIRSGVYFKQLRTDYAQTKYYREVIKECGYFRTYVDQNKN